jgi:hypothetical protein
MRVPQVDIVVPVRNEERELAIAAWVAAHFKKLTVGHEMVYDLTQPISGTV